MSGNYGDTIEIVVSGVEYAIPNTVVTERDILRAVDLDPATYKLYWDADVESLGPEQRVGAWEDGDHYDAPPVVVDVGDEFVAVPRYTEDGG